MKQTLQKAVKIGSLYPSPHETITEQIPAMIYMIHMATSCLTITDIVSSISFLKQPRWETHFVVVKKSTMFLKVLNYCLEASKPYKEETTI